MAKKVRLLRRDLEILELLVDRRVETLAYLHEHFFSEITRKSAMNRLGRLAAAGYLVRSSLLPAKGTKRMNHYRLGPKAKRALLNRSLAGEHLSRRFSVTMPERAVPHQLATNRVADWLGAELIPEHLLDVGGTTERKHRPDGVYEATPDDAGRRLVFVEVDLGHYSRERVLGKVRTFLDSPDARSILFVSENRHRARQISTWVTEAHGEHVMERVQPLTLDRIRNGGGLDQGTEPVPSPESPHSWPSAITD